jgi:hypothetical protein
LLVQGVRQSRVHLFLGRSENDRKDLEIGNVAEARKLPQRVLRVER